ncbi:MAG: DUF1428 domain-containing protein [Silicimonas sp.]|nr:DUF1428 domain-containing protein [Silicimonas sp.]RZW11833.1 MAG: DUF1428 domain-containing protein [Paracoccaceae bacterium]
MAYVDGFVIPVPTARKGEYTEYSKKWTSIFKEMGATMIYECWGDEVPAGDVTDFARAVDLKDEETVVFSWNVWPDKATRDAAWQSLRDADMEDMPFDGKRMIYGGFKPIVTVT